MSRAETSRSNTAGRTARIDRLPELATDLVRHQVSVIAAPGSTPAALAAKAATTTIPVLFQVGSDPVAAGLVASLARPGGNVTGVTSLNTELGPKRLELLRELMPTATIIAVLVNPTSPVIAEPVSRAVQPAARALGLQVHVLNAITERDFDTVFATFVQLRADALVIAPDAMFISRQRTARRIDAPPCGARDHPISRVCRGRRLDELRRQLYGRGPSGRCLHRPDTQGRRSRPTYRSSSPRRFELIINLKTARALGLNVPPALLARADEVIE